MNMLQSYYKKMTVAIDYDSDKTDGSVKVTGTALHTYIHTYIFKYTYIHTSIHIVQPYIQT